MVNTRKQKIKIIVISAIVLMIGTGIVVKKNLFNFKADQLLSIPMSPTDLIAIDNTDKTVIN